MPIAIIDFSQQSLRIGPRNGQAGDLWNIQSFSACGILVSWVSWRSRIAWVCRYKLNRATLNRRGVTSGSSWVRCVSALDCDIAIVSWVGINKDSDRA
jgi:hypothetical protein